MDRLDCDRMFVAVMETGSFAAAAARRRISSGQASKLVSRLEAELGVQLLKRTTRALAPTEVGQAYYLRVKDLLSGFDELDASVRNVAGIPAGRLRLTAPDTFGTTQLVPVLADFARAWPQIELDVSFADRTVNLVDEGFDLALRIGPPPDSSLVARRLCPARILLVATPAYLAARGTPLALEDLAAHDLIIDTNFRDPGQWHFAGGVQRPVSGRLRLANAEACLTAALGGLGITRVPSFVAGPLLRMGEVVQVLPEHEPPPYPVHALYPPSRHLAGKVRALVDYLAQVWKGEPAWDRGWR
ncbi:LysR family transcriptional regulator [Pseudogemmobacter sonorensis]|uniref:LysR family transcriptional regulator n=1 Tax=Pseudogemmobacter sonorensis TaxID=2989681 RepID=UPI00368A846A